MFRNKKLPGALTLLSVLSTCILSGPLKAPAEDSNAIGRSSKEPAKPQEVLQNLEQSRERNDGLPPGTKNLIIDKPKIAEQAMQRAVGLREAGNPHIRPGLLLSEIKDNPQVSKVDLQELREARLRIIERRDAPPQASKATPQAQLAEVERSSREMELTPESGVLVKGAEAGGEQSHGGAGLAVLGASIVLLAAGVVIYLKS